MIDCSTVHPETSKKLAENVQAAGGAYVASPVFGASPMAEAGKLIFCVAGPAEAITSVKPYLVGVMGKAVIELGEDVSKSSLLKIAG